MSTTWKARPTTYQGIPMRSRLEARVAEASLLVYADREGLLWISVGHGKPWRVHEWWAG